MEKREEILRKFQQETAERKKRLEELKLRYQQEVDEEIERLEKFDPDEEVECWMELPDDLGGGYFPFVYNESVYNTIRDLKTIRETILKFDDPDRLREWFNTTMPGIKVYSEIK